MNLLPRFSALITSLEEVSFGRMFRTKLQLVELKHKLEHHMEDHLLDLGEDHHQAHNVYDVALSQKDYDRLITLRVLIPELQEDLINLARERGYTLTTKPMVQLHADPHMIVGNVHINSSLADSRHLMLNDNEAQTLSGQVEPMHTVMAEGSQGPQQASLEVYPPALMPQAVLRLIRRGGQANGEQVYRLDREVINIGRQLSNDIVVDDKRISRHHAQVRYENGHFVIYDLGSTNGFGINGTQHLRQHILRDGDLVSVGSYDFIFQQSG